MSPVMPEWNNLKNEERGAICKIWEANSCPHACGGDAFYFYEDLRQLLMRGEKEYLRATMDGPV